MEGPRPPSPGEALELLALGGPADEQKPLNGTVQVVPLSGEEPRPAQANKENPWSSCNKKLIGKCKLWMVIASVFVGLIVVIIVSLCLSGVTYIDEDANEILELSSNKTFLVMLKIPEECVTEEELPHLLTKKGPRGPCGLRLLTILTMKATGVIATCERCWKSQPGHLLVALAPTLFLFPYGTPLLTDVYTSSPSLSRYFTSVEMTDFSGENATIAYHLQFGVPSEDDSFMRYMMNEELVRGVLLQSLHDEGVSGCETLGLGPASLLLYE